MFREMQFAHRSTDDKLVYALRLDSQLVVVVRWLTALGYLVFNGKPIYE